MLSLPERRIAVAPALVGLFPKSVYTPGEEARAMRIAIESARGAYRRPLPVYLGRKKLGYVFDDHRHKRVLWRTAATSIADIEAAIANGQGWKSEFYKNNTAGAGSLTGLWYDMYPNQGNPPPPSSPYSGAALTARAFTESMPGGIRHGGNVGSNFKQIAHISGSINSSSSALLFYDRCVAYDNCLFSASLQSMVNTVASPRYVTNGDGGMQIGCSSITGTGAGPVTLAALNYVNDQGSSASVPITTNHVSVTPSRSAFASSYGAELVCPYCTNAAGCSGAWIELAAADMGVQNITNITWSAADGTNTYCLFLARELAVSILPASNTQWDADQITGFMNYEQVVDGAYVCFMEWCTQGTAAAGGRLEFVWS